MTKSNGGRNRTKGHNAERHYADYFRKVGFPLCKTSRAASRLHDDSGIDLCFTNPFNIQIKAGLQRGLNPSLELAKITTEVGKNFPKEYAEHTNYNIVIHKKEVGRGRKRNEFDEIVSMTFLDFIKIVEELNELRTLKNTEDV